MFLCAKRNRKSHSDEKTARASVDILHKLYLFRDSDLHMLKSSSILTFFFSSTSLRIYAFGFSFNVNLTRVREITVTEPMRSTSERAP